MRAYTKNTTHCRPVCETGEWLDARVHLIGIGGCGMRGAAALLQRFGARVSGSDAQPFRDLGRLVTGGAVVNIGHSADLIPGDVGLIVISAAIPESNPELQWARQRDVPVMTYAELLGRLMSQRFGIAVAGTHGKSTTTSLAAYMLRVGGIDPSFIVGADCSQLGGSSGVGGDPHFVVESCEYARSFLHQRPRMAAILNIDRDHLDYYRDLHDIVSAFGQFAANVEQSGVIIAPQRDRAVDRVIAQANARVESFGLYEDADWQAADVRLVDRHYAFAVRHNGETLFETQARLAGHHNITNALAATALAWHGGAEPDAIDEAIRTFDGIERRMAVRTTAAGVTVIDDYAHHPAEISATLEAVRSRYEPRRTWVVFQPHQHSRTRLLMDEFADCLAGADAVIIPDIYSVRDSEEERQRTGSQELVSRIGASGGRAQYLPTLNDVTRHLSEQITDGDLVVTMGAGDVWKVADELAAAV